MNHGYDSNNNINHNNSDASEVGGAGNGSTRSRGAGNSEGPINWSRPQTRQGHARPTVLPENQQQPSAPDPAYLGQSDPIDTGNGGAGLLRFKSSASAKRGHHPDLSNDSTISGGYYYLPQDHLLDANNTSGHKYAGNRPIPLDTGIPRSGAWARQQSTGAAPHHPYAPIPEMSQIYAGDHTRYINTQTPPKHNFNDPDDEFQYDVQKSFKSDVYHHPPTVRHSTTSVATGVIDYEDAHDGDPDRVGAIDDDFSHSTTYPLDQARSASNHSNRAGNRWAGDHNFYRWQRGSNERNEELQRRLGARHLQMIALGGTLGVGLFLASGKALSLAGPLGALIGYTCMGFVVLCVMLSLGEMTALIPIPGGITAYAGRFVDDALGFAAGWMYWLSFATALPTEVTAASILIRFYGYVLCPASHITLLKNVVRWLMLSEKTTRG